jgi:hypothetical protein
MRSFLPKTLKYGAAFAVIVLAIPTAASAVTSVFSSSTAAPAVIGVNHSNAPGALAIRGVATGAHGTGLVGIGKKYGVYSAGALGVAAGKPLTCMGCVSPSDLSTLPSGHSESGLYAAAGATDGGVDYVGTAITYPTPLKTPISDAHVIDTFLSANSHCPGLGHAARGYLCLYPVAAGYFHISTSGSFFYSGGTHGFTTSPSLGAILFWSANGTGPNLAGEYTVTAP